jgi:hypothetical protein
MTVASRNVVGKYFAGGAMQRYESRLAELGAADRQHRRLEIHILKLEVTGFAQAQARDAQQPQKTT